MRELQNLYDKIAPQFDKLFTKRDEVAERIESLKAEMKEAEADYNISKMEQLTSSLSSAERIYSRIQQDIEKRKAEINGKSGDGLAYQVNHIKLKTMMEHNRSDRIQSQFRKIEGLKQEIEQIEESLKEQAQQDNAKVNELRKQFKKFYPVTIHVPRSPLYEYHAVEK